MKNAKILITLILALAMVFTLAAPAFAEEDVCHYVALGDSSANGFGLQGFDFSKAGKNSVVREAYIWQFADYLSEQLGKPVDIKNLALCGMRPNDLIFFLDKSLEREDLDECSKKWYGSFVDSAYGNRDNLYNTYHDAIEQADIITYDLGTNNFGNYMMARVASIFGIDIGFDWEGYNDEHFNDLMAKHDIDISIATKNQITELVENVTKGALSQDIQEQVIDAMLFSYANFVLGFRDSVDMIYDINPDVQLIIVGLANTLSGNVAKYGDVVIDLGAMWGSLMDMANAYIIDFNAHKGQYKFADNKSGVENVIQALARGDTYPDLVRDLIALFYSGDLFGSNAPAFVGKLAYGTDGNYIDERTALSMYNQDGDNPVKAAVQKIVDTFMSAAAYDGLLDIEAGLPYVTGGFNGLGEVVADAFIDYDSASDLAKGATKLSLNFLVNGTGAHPSAYGHQQKLAAVKAAYNSDITADGTHLVRFVNTAMNSFIRIFKSPNWLQTIRDLIREFIASILPISFL